MKNLKTKINRQVLAGVTFIILLLSGCFYQALQESSPAECAITIIQPINAIASNRPFYVVGNLEGTVPENATLNVNIIDENGEIVREVSTSKKNNPDSVITDSLHNLDETDTNCEKLFASCMPDLIADESGSICNADIKAAYSDNFFAALIANGVVEHDGKTLYRGGIELLDADGNEYEALPEGKYKIEVELKSKDTLLAKDESTLVIGGILRKAITRFSPTKHYEKVDEYIQREKINVASDLFPGYWDPSQVNPAVTVTGEIESFWHSVNLAEYSSNDTEYRIILYNLEETAASWKIECGELLYQQITDQPDRVKYFCYDIGEPSISDDDSDISVNGNIVPVNQESRLSLLRCDTVPAETEENFYNTEDPDILELDTDFSDGVTIESGDTIALYGVTSLVPNKKDELDFDTVKNQYTIHNRITTLQYRISGEGINETFEKETGLDRLFEDNDQKHKSLVEFRNVITTKPDWKGKTLTLTVTGIDANGNPADAEDSIELHIQ